MLIELYAAEQIIQDGCTDTLLAELAHPIALMRQATVDDDYRDYEAFIEGDRLLHQTLVAMTENHRLIEMYSELNVHMHVARAHYLNSVENARQAQQEHEAILEWRGV